MDAAHIGSDGVSGDFGPEKHIQSLTDLPIALLRAELARRADNEIIGRDSDDASTCGRSKQGLYNTPLHVIALFLILGLSTLACSFPVIARRFPRLPIPHRFLFLSRHFGTGVLIATAFVHLLPTAFVSLTDSCLPRFWNKTYPAMAGFVAMIAVFVVVTVEMIFAMKGAGHVHGSEYDNLISDVRSRAADDYRDAEEEFVPSNDQGRRSSIRLGNVREHRRQESILRDIDESSERLVLTPDGEPSDDMDADKNSEDLDLETSDPYSDQNTFTHEDNNGFAHRHSRSQSGSRNGFPGYGGHKSDIPLQNPQKQLLQCLLLEAGILFHSIFIGMALSVATGTSFIVLLVAISFHQTFEGFALGSRIASLIPDLFPPSSARPWLMCLAYGTTTPIGQAIGLVVHNLYDPTSATGLLMVGMTNAVSSGLLLFAGLVELLAEDFLSDSSYKTLTGRRRVEACVAVACGAMLMAFVGAFA